MLTREELRHQDIILARKSYFSVGLSETRGANICMELYIKGRLNPKTELCVNLIDVDQAVKLFLKNVDHKDVQKDIRPLFDQDNSFIHLDDIDFLMRIAWSNLKPVLKTEYSDLCQIKFYWDNTKVLVLGEGQATFD